MGSVQSLVSGVPLDFFILGGVVVILALDAIRAGIGRIAVLSIALPLALVAFSFVPQAYGIGSQPFLAGDTVKLATYGLLAAFIFALIRRMGLDYFDGGMGELLPSLIAAVGGTILMLTIWMELPLFDSLYRFGPHLQAAFAEQFRLFWFVGAHAAIAFARG